MSTVDNIEATIDEDFELFVRLSSGNRLRLQGNGLSARSSVANVKAAIEALLLDAPIASQRLIYKGRILDDDGAGLASYGVVHQSTLFLVVSHAAAQGTSARAASSITAAAAAAATTTTTATSSSTAAVPAPPPANNWASPASNAPSSDRLQQLLQSAMMSQHPSQLTLPGAEQRQQRPVAAPGGPAGSPGSTMEPWMQRLMRDMDPNFLATMLQSQLESNPALQRLMDQNPQLRHMMTDPAALQQAANMLRNPEAMQQAMRQQDLALSQLENMPGGFAALSSMYQSMQAPLEESLMSNRAESSSSTTTEGPSALPSSQIVDEGAAGTAMPNPWGSSSVRTSAQGVNSNRGRGDVPLAPRNPFLDMLSASSRGGGGSSSNSADGSGLPPLPSFPLPSPGTFRQPSADNNPWANMGNDRSQPPRPTLGGVGGVGGTGGTPDPLLRAALEIARQHPDQLREAILSNPSYRAMFGDNTSPEDFNRILEMALNPAVLEMMQQFEGLGGSHPGGFPPFPPPPPGDWSALMSAALQNPAAPQAGPALDFSNLLQGMSGGGTAATAARNPWASGGAPFGQSRSHPGAAPVRNPRDYYRRQLQQLAEMGFDSEGPCLAALQAEHGNLNRAVDRLLSGPPAPAPTPTQPASSSSSSSSSSPSVNDDAPSSAGRRGADEHHEPPAPPKDATDKKND